MFPPFFGCSWIRYQDGEKEFNHFCKTILFNYIWLLNSRRQQDHGKNLPLLLRRKLSNVFLHTITVLALLDLTLTWIKKGPDRDVNIKNECCRSMTFWYSDWRIGIRIRIRGPATAIFVSDLQDGKKKFKVSLPITFWSYIYIIF
jgi:hypothetical protein